MQKKGEIGQKARAWKGDAACYEAKHMWIIKHYGKADHCEKCNSITAKRFEWANISGQYKRTRDDYMQLCPSCHRRMDYGDKCKNGHPFTGLNNRGVRICIICTREATRRYAAKKKLSHTNK